MANTHFFEISAFFQKNLVVVFFIYGLSFFFMATSILLSFRTLKTTGLSRTFSYLLFFSLLHGAVEWIDLFRQYKVLLYGPGTGGPVIHLRFYLLASSFFFLLLFGVSLAESAWPRALKTRRYVPVMSLVFISILFSYGRLADTNMNGLEGAVRYLLGFPSTVIAGIALYRLSGKEYTSALPEGYGRHLKNASCSFIFYGIFSGLVVPESGFFLASYFNQDSFFGYTGVPVQILRAFSAFLISYFIIRSMALKISHRLMITFIAFFVMLVIIGFTGYVNLRLVIKSYKEVVKLETEEKDFSYLYKSFNRLYDFINTSKVRGNMESYKPLLKEYSRDFESMLDEIKSMEHEDKEERELIASIATLYRRTAKSGTADFGPGELDRLKSLINRISAMHSSEIEEQKGRVLGNASNFNDVISVVLAVSFFGFLFILYYFYRSILKPMNKLRIGAGQIAEGNLKHRIDILTADELQAVANDFNIMGEKLLERTARLEATTRELEELSVKDGLTGLYNHRHFYNRLTEEIKRAERNGTELSLLILDVDDFKHYNDRHGHLQGDDLLRKLGELVRNNLRDTDLACRYGGEEFAVILPETGKEGATFVAEKIRLSIENYEFTYKSTQPLGNVTVTIGVSTCPGDSKVLNELIKIADDALYSAKSDGKNKVYGWT